MGGGHLPTDKLDRTLSQNAAAEMTILENFYACRYKVMLLL